MTSLSGSLYSQVIDSKQYNYVGNWYNWQGGRFITNLNLPKVTATTGRDTGAIRYALADSSVYVWTGYQWRQVAGSSGADSSVFATRYYTQQTFVPYTGATGSVNLGAWGLTTDRLVFNQAPTLAGGVGTIRWNNTDGTLEFGMKGGNVTQQIGQELPVLMRNSTGSTITNGQVVYMSGSTGTNTIVALAKADAATTSRATIGIATEDIPNGQTGFITTYGKVRDLNTTGLTEGALVYLSSTVAGGLTSTPPTGDTYPVVVGICERTHAVNGVIFVHVDREFVRRYEIDTALAGKQGALTLTTTGTSGASTLIGNTLNIPQYAGGSSQTLQQTVEYGNRSDTTIYIGDSLQAAKINVPLGGVRIGDDTYTTASPIGSGGAYTKDSAVVTGGSYESVSPPISGVSYIKYLTDNINTFDYNLAISGSPFKGPGPNSFMSRLSLIPPKRPGIRYVIIGGSNILNEYNLDQGTDGLAAEIQRGIDTLHLALGYALDEIIFTNNPATGAFGNNTIDTARLYAQVSIAAARNAGVRTVDVYQYMVDRGGSGLFIGSDSIHANTVGHYAIYDAIISGGTSSAKIIDGLNIRKGGITLIENGGINFLSYNSTSSNRILTWDAGTTNNRSGIGKINTYGLGLFAPFAGDGVYAGLGQDATTLNSSTAHWYLSGITTARLTNFNSGLNLLANNWKITWPADLASTNKILFSDHGATNQKIGFGTTSDGNGGLTIFSQKFYFGGGDIRLGVGYDATNLTRTVAAMWVTPRNNVTVRDTLSIGKRLIIGDTTTTNAGNAWLTLTAGTTSFAAANLKTGTLKIPAEAGDIEYTTPKLYFTNSTAIRQEIPLIQQSRVSTQFDATSNTTLANITGLTASVAASGVYRFEATLYTSSIITGGVKVAIGGTATATAIIYEGLTTNAGLTTQSRSTALGTAVGAVTAVTAGYIKITGTITVNAAGTLTVQFAQNASDATASSVLVGSVFVVTQTN